MSYISTVGDLIKALESFDPTETIALYVNGRRERFFSVSEEVCQDDFYGPASIYVYGQKDDLPLFPVVFLGDNIQRSGDHNRRVAGVRGEPVHTPDSVRAMIQLDPKPYVYTDPVSEKKTRLRSRVTRSGAPVEFKPRDGFVSDESAYEVVS